MNEELGRLERIDRTDRELARVDAELAKLATRLEERAAAVTRAEQARGEAKAALDANRAEERTGTRRLEDLRSSHAAAMRVLTSGLGDPEAAQRQLDRCGALIDEAETAMLELLEAQDVVSAAERAAEQALAAASRALADERAVQPAQVAALEAARAVAQAERSEVLAGLAGELRGRYDGFRERGRYAVARVRSGSCEACSMAVQPQMMADLRNDKLVTCHGCHRWLVPT